MTVGDLMIPEPVPVHPETEIAEAARLVRDLDVRALPVTGADGLVGIVTATDIVTRCVADNSRVQLVGSIMTPVPEVVSRSEPAEVAEAVMAFHAIDHLPVCHAGELVGMLSREDLSRRFASEVRGEQLLHEVRQELERLERKLSGRRRVLRERGNRSGRLRAAAPDDDTAT